MSDTTILRFRSWRVAATTAAALLASLLAVLTINTTSASADCVGSSHRSPALSKSFSGSSGVEGSQTQETCSGNSVYYGRVRKTGGTECTYARFQDPIGSHYTQGFSCTTGSWSNYTFWDQTSTPDSWALINLCIGWNPTMGSECYYTSSPHGTPTWGF